MAERGMDGGDYRRLVEEAAEGLERPVRYQGFEPPDHAGDCRIEVLVSEVPHELIVAPDLVRRDGLELPGDELVQEPAETPREAPRALAGTVRERIREALILMMRENYSAVRVSRTGVTAVDHPERKPTSRAA